MSSKKVFLTNYLKKPKEVAAVIPSSKYVVKRLMSEIDFSKADCVVEYGPGVGNITGSMLKRMKAGAKLLCFETNKEFCRHIKKEIRDRRLVVINDSAASINRHLKKLGMKKVDYAISGIPFSLIEKPVKKEIMKKTWESMGKGSRFIIYQHSSHVKKFVAKHFRIVKQYLELRNIPPYFIFVCEKS